jgi:hypothetical protein
MAGEMDVRMRDAAATDAGRHAGWIHANYVDAYGSAQDVVSECPPWFEDSATFWQAGFDEGRELFTEGCYVDGTPMP